MNCYIRKQSMSILVLKKSPKMTSKNKDGLDYIYGNCPKR